MNTRMRYQDDIFTEEDGRKFRSECFRDANPRACHLLGQFFESKKDFQKAGLYYRVNCDYYKFARSCVRYADIQLLGDKLEDKVMVSKQKTAMDYFSKACHLGIDDACLQGGLMYFSREIRDDKTKLYEVVKKGMDLLEIGCERKQSACCFYLSTIYRMGILDFVMRDLDKSRNYAERACQIGHVHACLILSTMYLTGEGVTKDEEKSLIYRARAFELQEAQEKSVEDLRMRTDDDESKTT